jgi:predicted O-methyltransferase YrrM
MSISPDTIVDVDSIACDARNRIEAYGRVRRQKMPFPWESVFVWCALLSLQKAAGIRGDLLEVGVAKGGTALLSLQSCAEDERQQLVDHLRDPDFDRALALLDDALQARATFHERDSAAPELAPLEAGRYRWIHIDAGHLREQVAGDLARFAPALQEDGLLVLDDVFEIRWPGVTEAMLQFFSPDDSPWLPVLLANRKAYFARRESADAWLSLLSQTLDGVLGSLGRLRHWQAAFLGGMPHVVKLSPDRAMLAELPP